MEVHEDVAGARRGVPGPVGIFQVGAGADPIRKARGRVTVSTAVPNQAQAGSLDTPESQKIERGF
ncbi:MAG: hypothetical protein EA422_00935 [Gemmatimonadales bacterium]|nr:MAG: hypothetical protein EA422_00935 [Gemmatimonadales bacterium]